MSSSKKKYITQKQLAERLGISRSTLYRWLKEKEIKLSKRLISPDLVKRIEQRLKEWEEE